MSIRLAPGFFILGAKSYGRLNTFLLRTGYQQVDEIVARASQLGAKIETQPTNSFWGTRYAALRDPFGHRWILNAPLDSGNGG